MIAWKYVDKTAATVAAMRDYNNMAAIIGITPDEIKELDSRMTSPKNGKVTGMPTARNPQARENTLVSQLKRMDALNKRYGTAAEYMAWFEPAWDALTGQERRILEACYMSGSFRGGARARLANELEYTERHIDRLRGNALQRLTVLLFG